MASIDELDIGVFCIFQCSAIWQIAFRTRENLKIRQTPIDEYKAFVKENYFHFPNSKYLDDSISIVFEYTPSFEQERGIPPVLNLLFVKNTNRSLPKSIFLVKENKAEPIFDFFNSSEKPTLVFHYPNTMEKSLSFDVSTSSCYTFSTKFTKGGCYEQSKNNTHLG